MKNNHSESSHYHYRTLNLLFPKPQKIDVTDGHIVVSKQIQILVPQSNKRILKNVINFQNELKNKGIECQIEDSSRITDHSISLIELQITKSLFHQLQSYKLIINSSGISITGSDESGLFYGIQTLSQLFKLSSDRKNSSNNSLELPHLIIEDWPDFLHRGVMIDISRDKVPTMETLLDLVELLSKWKINQLQLYMEHTFAYRGHEKIWQDSSPFTGEEIEILDSFCQERFIELVPNQNSFGHFHRWLVHDPYTELAECPEGFEHPFSLEKEPFSLCPTDPGSIELLKDLYDQLLPHFNSSQFNVGLDETFDLGVGRSSEICTTKSKGEVYFEFFQKIHSEVAKRGKIMQFWADIIFEYPELIEKLPEDVIALVWGYEAEHPFEELSKILHEKGLAYYVCPGTSSWNSIAGRTENAIKNLQNAAINGKRNFASGFLITDWGDHGHLQPLPISYLGFLTGAGVSWNIKADLSDISLLLSIHGFRDNTGVIGKIAYDLGNTYKQIDIAIPNNSVLFLLLLFSDHPMADIFIGELDIEELKLTHHYIDDVMKSMPKAEIKRTDSELICREFQWAANTLKFACDFGIAQLKAGSNTPINQIPENTRTQLTNDLLILIDQYEEIWLERNRLGGLNDSIDRLRRVLRMLES